VPVVSGNSLDFHQGQIWTSSADWFGCGVNCQGLNGPPVVPAHQQARSQSDSSTPVLCSWEIATVFVWISTGPGYRAYAASRW
jgi:hypothetical protein